MPVSLHELGVYVIIICGGKIPKKREVVKITQSKSMIFILSLVLVFAVVPMVEAASTNFQYDFLAGEFSIRGEQSPLYAEVPFAEKDWGAGKVWGLSGFNVGLKGPDLTPFYGKIQFNWERSTTTNEFDFVEPEIGLGGVYDLWEQTTFGAEINAMSPSLKNIEDIDWSFEVYLKYDLNKLLGYEPSGAA